MMTKSELTRRRIVWHLRFVWRWWDGSAWQSFAALASELKTDVSIIKREVRRLARLGALYYSRRWNDDGMVSGSGYFLSPDWEVHRPDRESDPRNDEFKAEASDA